MKCQDRTADEVHGLKLGLKIADELHGLKLGLKILYTKVNELQDSVKDLSSFAKTDISATRELVRQLGEEIKKIEGKPTQITQIVTRPVPNICEKCDTTKFAMQGLVGGVLLLAMAYGYMSVKGISMSDVVNGAKGSVAGYLSLMAKHLGQKSAALTETLRHLTEQMENYGKPPEQSQTLNQKINEVCAVSNPPISRNGQEYSDMLFNLVMEEAPEFDEKFLGDVFDYLNENHIAARGYISKPPNMRKKWLGEFSKKSFEKI